MHRLTSTLAASALLLSSTAVFAQDPIPLENTEAQASYALGFMSVRQLVDPEIVADIIDLDAYIAGVREAFAAQESRITREEMAVVFEGLQKKIVAARQAKDQERATAALEEGRAFLERNATQDGITVTESGVQYKIINEGAGASPTIDQSVTVHYVGKLLSGVTFDSSLERGAPATFPLGGVIRGWTEVLQLMSPGDEWEVWIPSELAYGPSGPPSIGPNQVLNFTIQLLSIDE